MLYSAVRFSGKSNLRNFEVEAHFLLEARKKVLFTWPWLHFLEVFGAVLIVAPATWSSSSAARSAAFS